MDLKRSFLQPIGGLRLEIFRHTHSFNKLKACLALALALVLGLGLTGLAFALVGDLDISGDVADPDMTIVETAYRSHSWEPPSPNWDWRADIDRDDAVDLTDLTLAGRNYGETFNFHWARRLSNGRDGNPSFSTITAADMAVDSRGNAHIVFSDDDELYYTQIDGAGNTLVDDVYLDNLVDDPRLAVDSQDNVHIVWHATYDPGNMKDGVLYARLDSVGRIMVQPRLVLDRCVYPAVAADSFGHPHVLGRDASGRLFYLILDDHSHAILAPTRLNTQYDNASQPAIAIDADDTRHILWYVDTPGTAGDLIYTRIPYGELPYPNQMVVSHITSWNPRRLVVGADSLGAAHVLWHDSKGDGTGAIYWRRVNPDGELSAERLVTVAGESSAGLSVRFTIDASDRIHLVARDAALNLSYARLDRDANTLVGFRTIVYGGDHTGHYGHIALRPDGEALVAYEDQDDDYGGDPLFVVSTLPDAPANDKSRADVVLDNAHLQVSPLIARVIDTAHITLTVSNAGWEPAKVIVVNFYEKVGGTEIPPVLIASLPPFSSTTVARSFDIPHLEETTLLDVLIEADVESYETTLANNVVTATFGILPPAQSVDFLVQTFDETYAPDNPDFATPLYGGVLTLEVDGLGYTDEVTSTRAYNAFLGVPLDTDNPPDMRTVANLGLSAPGFSDAKQEVTAERLELNPYAVQVTPTDPIKMYVNQWGDISGTVYSGTTSTRLPNAAVTLDGGHVTLSDGSGNFSFTRVVSGTHTLNAILAGNAPTGLSVQVFTGDTATPAVRMPGTRMGYVSGVVRDDLGRTLQGATVRFKGGATTLGSIITGDDGRFSFEVADAQAYANYTLEAEAALCDPFTSNLFSLTPGVPHEEDILMSWSDTAASLHTSDDVTSWTQRENWGEVHDDGISIGDIVDGLAMIFGYESFPSYEVEVGWGKYHYSLALNYSEVGGVKTVEALGVDLANGVMYSYDVEGGIFHNGSDGPDMAALRLERVDLVTLDANNNVTGVLWHDDDLWYASSPDGTPAWDTYDVATQAPDWGNVAIRVFLRVGKYDPDPSTGHWAPWHPPVSLVSLGGTGSGAGADYQCLIWRLSGNSVEIVQSMSYYADVVGGGAMVSAPVLPAWVNAPSEPQSVGVSLSFPNTPPAHVGTLFPVDVRVIGAAEKPVYGIEFDLTYNPAYLELASVEGAPDFLGPYGAWALSPQIVPVSSNLKLTDMAVVRLGAPDGLAAGALARLWFKPLAVTPSTSLDLSDVWLSKPDGATYRPDSTSDNTLAIEEAVTYLPCLVR